MSLKDLFNNWAQETDKRYKDQQWLLSKWDTLDGVDWPDEKIGLMLNHIRRYLRLERTHCFLDVGCGGGWILDRLGPCVATSFGCDLSLAMLSNVSGRYPVFNADACQLPVQSDVMDRVLCYFVFINFMDLDMVSSAIREIVRVLEPGGRALLGQLPDQTQSQVYDVEKRSYVNYCQDHFRIFRNTRDVHAIPIQLFERRFFSDLLEHLNCGFQFVPAFNPFYRPGQPAEINWRFDIVVEKK